MSKSLTFSFVLGLGTLLSLPALARDMNDAERREARERFDRGLVLFNQGDTGGAYAEFSRAYELSENPVVLLNIAKVHAAANHPVLALEALEILETLSSLSDGKRAEVQSLLAEQSARVGSLQIEGAPPGAKLEIDGIEVGEIKAEKPIRVAAGRHVYGILASGYLPLRRAFSVAGRETKREKVSLEAVTGPSSRLRLAVAPIDTALFIDGTEVGLVQNMKEIEVAPGRHEVRLERAGYRSVTRELTFASGSAFDLAETLAVDASAPGQGAVTVRASEKNAVVFVDGATYEGALLPVGRHELRVERSGFFPVTRVVDVRAGSEATVEVTLAPTAAYRAEYVKSAESTRTWAYVSGGAGLAALAGGVAYIVWNAGDVSDKQALYDDAKAAFAACDNTGTCKNEDEIANIALDGLDEARALTPIGYGIAGVGLVGVGLGVGLYLFGDDPDRYEPKEQSDVFGSLEIRSLRVPSAQGLEVSGTF